MRYLWQLPQNILALIIYIIHYKRICHETYIQDIKVVWMTNTRWGVSLGNYIFVSSKYHNQITVSHEYGHCLQSRIFGPLYLLIIGLPSITMNIMTTLGLLKAENYYKRWPENWADKLAGIKR